MIAVYFAKGHYIFASYHFLIMIIIFGIALIAKIKTSLEKNKYFAYSLILIISIVTDLSFLYWYVHQKQPNASVSDSSINNSSDFISTEMLGLYIMVLNLAKLRLCWQNILNLLKKCFRTSWRRR